MDYIVTGVLAPMAAGVAVWGTHRWWGGSRAVPLRARFWLMIAVIGIGWLAPQLFPHSWRWSYNGFVAIWAVVAWVDFSERIIPNRLVVATVAWALVESPQDGYHWLVALATGAGIFLFYLVVHLVTRGGLGMGDVKFSGAVGFGLGWPAGLTATVAGVWAAGLFAAWLLVARRRSGHDSIALGPFLALGGIVGLLIH